MAAQPRWWHSSQVLQGQSTSGLSNKGCDSRREPCFLSVFIVFGPPPVRLASSALNQVARWCRHGHLSLWLRRMFMLRKSGLHYFERRVSAMDRRWKVGLGSIIVALGILYVGWVVWSAVQDVILSSIAVACMLVVGFSLIATVVSSYWKEIFVAVVGMVVGTIAG